MARTKQTERKSTGGKAPRKKLTTKVDARNFSVEEKKVMKDVGSNSKQYQKFPDYPPDKTSTWVHPIEKDGWILAHNSLRSEIENLIMAVSASMDRIEEEGPLEEWEVSCLQRAWKAHMDHMHAHHFNEDDLLNPFIETRAALPMKMADDHKVLEEHMNKIDAIIQDLAPGKTLKDLLTAFQEYKVVVYPHFTEEEIKCVPVVRAFFTPVEVAAKVAEILKHGPPVEMGSFINAMAVDVFRNEFMKQEGIPSFVWFIDFQFKLKAFREEFQEPIESLLNGDEPPCKHGILNFLLSLFK